MFRYFWQSILLALLLTQTAGATRIIVGNLGFEKIPASENRRIVGTWLLRTLDCTRSIEAVNDRFFMVSRCRGKAQDGSGLPIRRVQADLYEGQTTNWTYQIAENGSLVMRNRRGMEYIGEPHADLWP